MVVMECCHFVPLCHGPVTFHLSKRPLTTGLKLNRKRVIACGDASRQRIAATSTLPGTPGSSRRVSYQEPQRLLQTEQYKNSSIQESSTPTLDTPSTSGREDIVSRNAEAVYTIHLTTSNEDRSGLSIANAGIMLSLIGDGAKHSYKEFFHFRKIQPLDHYGSNEEQLMWFISVAQIFAASPPFGLLPKQVRASLCTYFDHACVAALCTMSDFPGSYLTGTWQLAQVTVTLMPCEQHGESGSDTKKGLFHMFSGRDIRLGDGEDFSAVELKPSQVFECTGPEDPAVTASQTPTEPLKTPQESAKLREAGMRDYESLKIFLLGSTAAMVGVGMVGFYLLGASDMAQGFAVGGAGGLVYLLLIQRAVDQLPGPDQAGSVKKTGSAFSNIKVKTPAASFALFVGLALVVTRGSQASTVISLPPQELLAGALGFFTSKIAVFLAAFNSTDGRSDHK